MCDTPNVPRPAPPPPQHTPPPQRQAPPVRQQPHHTPPSTAPAPVAEIHQDCDDRSGQRMVAVGAILVGFCSFLLLLQDGRLLDEVAWSYFTWLALCALVGKIGHSKGYSYYWGMGLSTLVSPLIGLIVVVTRPKNTDELELRKIWSGEAKKCPHCAEIVKREAVVCRHCGRNL